MLVRHRDTPFALFADLYKYWLNINFYLWLYLTTNWTKQFKEKIGNIELKENQTISNFKFKPFTHRWRGIGIRDEKSQGRGRYDMPRSGQAWTGKHRQIPIRIKQSFNISCNVKSVRNISKVFKFRVKYFLILISEVSGHHYNQWSKQKKQKQRFKVKV
jgi:hypothetical protein